ncbi:hypothetical protein PRIPAC_88792 [Pristionchus pacificus]|uniref:EGF domain-containing protein n=1 Tax=Pristionchus pacificus TaxID=54126 RepID=A0A2A6B738_PRIPA|nr:hypothetical protein PRIPAC_88792 [Pristionchus pacificus]|eukprot:PDM61681.1 EGF domain-containing protein [Pristionchus pacificus]
MRVATDTAHAEHSTSRSATASVIRAIRDAAARSWLEVNPFYTIHNPYHEPNACEPSPCLNEGLCLRRKKGFRCLCKEKFGGRNCDQNA